MGRELKRVALDFDWPLEKVWEGYLNPHYKPCPATETNECHAGYSNAGKWLDCIAHFISMLGTEAVEEPYKDELIKRGRIWPHPYLESYQAAPRTELPREVSNKIREMPSGPAKERAMRQAFRDYPPKLIGFGGEEMVSLVKGLADGQEIGPLSGGMTTYRIWCNLIKAAGFDPDSEAPGRWGICKVCNGECLDPAVKEAYEAWKKEEPPAGPGWQLWETVSEGSPVSKVYPTQEAFEQYLVDEGYTRSAAKKFCEVGWVPTGMIEYPADGSAPVTRMNIETLDVPEGN